MEFLKKSEELAVLKSYQSLAVWDYETLMPKGAGAWRSQMLGYMAGQIHQKFTSEDYLNSAREALSVEKNQIMKAAIENTIHEIEKYKKIPQKLVEEISETSNLAHAAWDEAKKTNNYKLFAPHLEKMISLITQQAQYLAQGKTHNLYDALLEEYSPGMTSEFITKLFQQLRPELTKLIQERKTKLEKTWVVPVEVQKQICLDVMKWMKIEKNNFTMALSSHPFCLGIHPDDIRLTTRYDENDPLGAIFSVVHELGHGLYEHQLNKEFPGTARMEANGMDLHESQSRFWEVCIGSSKEFYHWIWNWFETHAPQHIAGWTFEELYLHGTQVSPSLIRTESDPVTYGMHIMIRFEIEQLIMSGKLKVNDIPQKWNALYKEYLGVDVPSDTLGVLQDVHWTGGFGYFPSYLLGTMIACQLFEALEKKYPQILRQVEFGDVKVIHEWLKENVHQYGKGKSTRQILIDTTDADLRVEPFLNLLRSRFCK